MICLSLLQPLVGDDVINVSALKQAEGPFDYIWSMFLTYTGRLSTLAILTLGYTSFTALKVLQAIKVFVFFYTAYLICCLSLDRKAHVFSIDLLFYLLVLAGMWFGLASFSFTITWFTGGVVYLVPACAFLLFLSPFVNHVRRIECRRNEERERTPWFTGCGLFLFGFVAANGHELLSAAALFLVTVWILFC